MHTRTPLMLVAAGGLALSAAFAQPLIDPSTNNGSFETDAPNGTAFLVDRWFAFGNASVDASAEIAAEDGVNSIKMFDAAFNTGAGAQSDSGVFQLLPVTAGTEYVLSAYVHNPSIDPLIEFTTSPSFGHVATLVIDYFDDDRLTNPSEPALGSATVDAFDIGTDPQDQWVQKQVISTAPAGATLAQVTLVLVTFDDPATGALWWDDVVLEENLGCPLDSDLNADGVTDVNDILDHVELVTTDCSTTTLFDYQQTFETLDPANPNALADDGWLVGANVFDTDGTTFLYNYFAFPAPNGGSAFSAIDTNQGGVDQGLNQLSVYNDYNNIDHANGFIIEANVFREYTLSALDVGKEYFFNYSYKLGNLVPPSTAVAFIKVLDPNNGFSETLLLTNDTTGSVLWSGDTLTTTIDPSWEGQIFQIGFWSTATNYESSGVFYDNLELEFDCTGAGDTNGDGAKDMFDLLDSLNALKNCTP